MDLTKRRVQINVEACGLNLGKAIGRDSSTIGLKKTCIDLSFSSEMQNYLERQVYLTSTLVTGIQNARVVFPGLWTDSLSCGTFRRAVKAQRSSEVPTRGEWQREKKTSNYEVFVHKLCQHTPFYSTHL